MFALSVFQDIATQTMSVSIGFDIVRIADGRVHGPICGRHRLMMWMNE